jgi:hypothetical protein
MMEHLKVTRVKLEQVGFFATPKEQFADFMQLIWAMPQTMKQSLWR